MAHTVGYTNSEGYRCLENLRSRATELHLTYCGWERCEPGHRFGPNRRSSYVLHLIQDGKGVLEMDQASYALGKGDAFFIPAGAEAWYEADPEEPWSYYWIGFRGVSAEDCARSAGFTANHPVRLIGCMESASTCIDQMMEAHQLFYESELRRNALLMLVFSELIEDHFKMIRRGRTEGMKTGPQSEHRYSAAVYVAICAGRRPVMRFKTASRRC